MMLILESRFPVDHFLSADLSTGRLKAVKALGETKQKNYRLETYVKLHKFFRLFLIFAA